MIAAAQTEIKQNSVLSDSKNENTAWTHEGFLSRMDARLDKVRRLLCSNDETPLQYADNQNSRV